MIALLKVCNLKIQNRLFDMEQKSLYSMSMTELYSLSVVAELSFLKSCRELESPAHPVSHKCREAIFLVGSACRLIASLWCLPAPQNDFSLTSSVFIDPRNADYISRSQKLVDQHLSHLRALCQVDADIVEALEHGSIPRPRMAAVHRYQRHHTECLLAKKCVDKPTVHRLVELVYSTLPMVGHASRVGELVLEKCHQSLKRAICQGNNRDVQLTAMSSVMFTDWKGRLSIQANDALEGNYSAMLGCFRLLAGRDAVASVHAHLSAIHKQEVILALGPVSCVPTFLQTEKSSVVALRALRGFYDEISWSFLGNYEVAVQNATLSDPMRNRALVAFKNAYRFRRSFAVYAFADELRATTRTGDVVEIQCYKPYDIPFHCPFLIHHHSIGNAAQGTQGSTIWAVSSLFRPEHSDSDSEFWACLRPCLPLAHVPPFQGFYRHHPRYYVGQPIRFARVGLYMTPVAVLHDCDPVHCHFVQRKPEIAHFPQSVFDSDAIFFTLRRSQGYPPRSA